MPGHHETSPPATPSELLSIVAANVRRLRAESGWTTRAFAEHANLSLSTLYGIEHAQQKTVRLSTIEVIATAFGVQVADILGEERRTGKAPPDGHPLSIAATSLSKMRGHKGWTQEELADRAGVARDIVAKIERQTRNPTLDVLDRLARALGCSAADFFNSSPGRT